MKKLMIFLAAILCLVTTSSMTIEAQNTTVNSFLDKYAESDGFTTVTIKPKMFELIAALDIDAEGEDAEVYELIANLQDIRILVSEGNNLKTAFQYYDELNNQLQNNYYSELMTVKSDSDNVRFMVKEGNKKGLVHELLMTVVDGEGGEFVCISLAGDIDLQKIGKLAQMDVEGMEHLEKLGEK